MQMTFYTGRIHPKYAFAASCVGKDGQPELSGKVSCLLPGSIATVEWKFTGYAGQSDEYDSYAFTITPPPEVSDGTPKSIDVQFDGSQAIPFENSDCVLMLCTFWKTRRRWWAENGFPEEVALRGN